MSRPAAPGPSHHRGAKEFPWSTHTSTSTSSGCSPGSPPRSPRPNPAPASPCTKATARSAGGPGPPTAPTAPTRVRTPSTGAAPIGPGSPGAGCSGPSSPYRPAKASGSGSAATVPPAGPRPRLAAARPAQRPYGARGRRLPELGHRAGRRARLAGTVHRPGPRARPGREQLLQGQFPVGPDGRKAEGTARAEELLDLGFPGWRERTTWRTEALADGRTGAVDRPGTTWRDRPSVIRGDGVFLAGDQVAAPGLLSEVSFTSGLEAGLLAVRGAGRHSGAGVDLNQT